MLDSRAVPSGGEGSRFARPRKDDSGFVLIVTVVAVVCIGVFVLPLDLQNALKARHAVFNPITSITASFVHGDLQHLEVNLFFFVLFAFLLYFVNEKVGEQRFFLFSFLSLFTVLPILNYGALFYFGIYGSVGFGFGLSLVDGGLIGLTVPSLILYFRRRVEKFNPMLFFTSMVLFTFSLISLAYAESFQYPLWAICAVLGIVFGLFEIKRIVSFLAHSRKQSKTFRETFLVAFALWFYFVSIISLFPSTIVSRGGIIDIVSHYIGLLFGIIIFSFYSIARKHGKNRARALSSASLHN